MFNQILAQGYSGGQALYTWSFDDGSRFLTLKTLHTLIVQQVFTRLL